MPEAAALPAACLCCGTSSQPRPHLHPPLLLYGCRPPLRGVLLPARELPSPTCPIRPRSTPWFLLLLLLLLQQLNSHATNTFCNVCNLKMFQKLYLLDIEEKMVLQEKCAVQSTGLHENVAVWSTWLHLRGAVWSTAAWEVCGSKHYPLQPKTWRTDLMHCQWSSNS